MDNYVQKNCLKTVINCLKAIFLYNYIYSIIAKAAAPKTPACPPNFAFSIEHESTNTFIHLLATSSFTVSKTMSPPFITPPPITTFSGSKVVIILATVIPK